jgi:ribosome-associated protein
MSVVALVGRRRRNTVPIFLLLNVMQPMIDEPFDYDDPDAPRGPSKSSIKREMHALQALGEELVALSADRLAKVPLSDELRDAVADARRFTKHEAKRRQMQYIGRLMRLADPEPIRAQLDIFNGASKAEVARQHRLEKLRTDFLDDEKIIGVIAERWPGADLQHLRVLRRNALKEREQNKPPRAYRELFRVLRDLEQAEVDLVEAARDDEPEDGA